MNKFSYLVLSIAILLCFITPAQGAPKSGGLTTKESLYFDMQGNLLVQPASDDLKAQLKEGDMVDLGREVFSYETVVPSESVNATESMTIRSYGNSFLCKKGSINYIFLRISADRSDLGLPLFVLPDYNCSLAPADTAKSDYPRYINVVKLLKKIKEVTDSKGNSLPLFLCDIGGADPVAGKRHFSMWVAMHATKGTKMDYLAMGVSPGTRVVLGDGVTLTLKQRDGNNVTSHNLVGGDTFEFTLDSKLRIQKK